MLDPRILVRPLIYMTTKPKRFTLAVRLVDDSSWNEYSNPKSAKFPSISPLSKLGGSEAHRNQVRGR